MIKMLAVCLAGLWMTLGLAAHAQTISPDAYGMELRYPSVTPWPKLYIAHSRIEVALCSHIKDPARNGYPPDWAEIEIRPPNTMTGAKNYTWTALTKWYQA